jgi:hypothetical protein
MIKLIALMGQNQMRVFIGWDERERAAYDVAKRTAEDYGCAVSPLYESRLRKSGLLTRPVDRRHPEGDGGKFWAWDFNSSAPQSTEFAISRFFVPILAHSGWCLFVDADVVFLQDPHELLAVANPAYAVQVVKHKDFEAKGFKMDGQIQTSYRRKLWSSVVLWNVDHDANRRINLELLNTWPGRDLHAFGWLADEEIGCLPEEANWLVGLQEKPARPIIAHYTLGTPNLPGLESSEHADLWHQQANKQ